MVRRIIVISSVWLAFVGCGTEDTAPPSREVPVGGVGERCALQTNCRDGLSCLQGVCQPAADKIEGDACQLSGECAESLYCGITGVCEPGGDTPEGSACGAIGDCVGGLICQPNGLTGVCAQGGEGDIGAECETTADCLAGLGCGAEPLDPTAGSQCLHPSQGGIPIPFGGDTCIGDGITPDGPLRVYFEVPDGDGDNDFYRLPFPNDARTNGTQISVADHPTPGNGILGFDIVKTYLDAIERAQSGFGLNQAAYIRFSGRLDFDSLDARGDDPSHFMVNIDPDSAGYAQRQSIFWSATTGRGLYICHNWMSVRPSWGRPLDPNTTYAVLFTDKIRGESGQALEQDTHFAAMLQEDRPAPELVDAWNAYGPLRTFLAEQEIDPATIMGAAVYTTGDPRAVARQLRGAVRDFGVPQMSDLTLCDDAETASPCATEGNEARNCVGAGDNFSELHARLQLPIFQQGEAPYLETGGGLEVGPDGPVVQRNEQVCTAMTIPDGAMPETGWPVLIYGHGTGGGFTSHVGNISGLVSSIEVGEQTTGVLVIGWDQVQHATRRGDSDADPENLVFNFLNPDAALGNWQQSAADLHAIVSFVENLDIPAEDSPTGAPIKADPSQIYYLGHSQGGTTGAIALPYEPSVRGTVLSGTGASLTLSLVNKTSPVNIPAGVGIALQDPNINSNHQVLSLIQGFFDPVDPVNYAQYIGARQIEEVTTPRHVLHTLGLRDTFTPRETLETMNTALRAQVVGPLIEPFASREITPVDAPVSGNANVNGESYTVVSRQYEPGDYDGHFVLFRDTDAIDDMLEFLGTGILEGVPTIAD